MYFVSRQYNGRYVIGKEEGSIYAFDLKSDKVETTLLDLGIEDYVALPFDDVLDMIFECEGREGVQTFIQGMECVV